MDALLKQEEKNMKKYDHKKTELDFRKVLTVSVKSVRDISAGWSSDMVDTPDPKISVCVPGLPSPNKYFTRTLNDTTDHDFEYEVFRWPLPSNYQGEHFDIEVTLCDEDSGLYLGDDHLGTHKLDGADFAFGKKHQKSLHFGKGGKYGTVNIEVELNSGVAPDLRLSLGIHQKEKDFRLKRLPKVFNALKALLGEKDGPRNLEETPIIALVASGGGYRAATGMCGFVEGLTSTGLFDTLTYTAGLSGGSWYLTGAYARKEFTPDKQFDYHEHLKDGFSHNMYTSAINPVHFHDYKKKVKSEKEKYEQPTSLVDYWGYLVGRAVLGKHEMNHRFSEVQEYIKDGDVPFPIMTSSLVKLDQTVGQYHVFCEQTPYEIALPEWGVGVPIELFGSVWNEGFVTRRCPEVSLHFIQGMDGSAFAIDIADYMKNHGTETPEMDHATKQLIADEEAKDEPMDSTMRGKSAPTAPSMDLANRDFLIPHTAKVLNVTKNCSQIKPQRLNPEYTEDTNLDELLMLDDAEKKFMSTVRNVTKMDVQDQEDSMSLIDAGIHNNVPVEVMDRPARQPDVIIVCDVSGRSKDDVDEYPVLRQAVGNCWNEGLYYPGFMCDPVSKEHPTELIIFEPKNSQAPTVIWFGLCNTEFKNKKDYQPHSKEKPDQGDDSPFNVFPLFENGGKYATSNLCYSPYTFDRFRELYRFNMESHAKEVKEAIIRAISKKQKLMA